MANKYLQVNKKINNFVENFPFGFFLVCLVLAYLLGVISSGGFFSSDFSAFFNLNTMGVRLKQSIGLNLLFMFWLFWQTYRLVDKRKFGQITKRILLMMGIIITLVGISLSPPKIAEGNYFYFLNYFWGQPVLISIYGMIWAVGWSIILIWLVPERFWRKIGLFVGYYRIIFLAVLVLGIAYTVISFGMQNNFKTSGFDLGIYDQTLWQMVYNHSLVNTVSDYGNAFGAHFQPILFLITPFYRLWSDPRLLMLVEVAVVTAGALPVYRLSKRYFNNHLMSLALVLAYFLFVGNQKALNYSFHPSTLMAPMLLFAFDYFDQKKYLPHYLFIFLALLCKENASMYIVTFGVLILWKYRTRWRIGLSYIFLGFMWIWLVKNLIMPAINGNAYGFFTYDEVGKNIGQAAVTFVSNPLYIVKTMLNQPAKADSIVLHLSGSSSLALFSPFSILLLPSFLEKFLSTRKDMWTSGYHYGAPMAFGYLVATMMGIKALIDRYKVCVKPDKLLTFGAILVILSTFAAVIVHRMPILSVFRQAQNRSIYQAQSLEKFRKLIPKDASLSAQGAIVPHFSGRAKIYNFPVVKDAQYVLLNQSLNPWPLGKKQIVQQMNNYKNDKNWQLLTEKDNFSLFKRVKSESGK